jgi:hypothetical protein
LGGLHINRRCKTPFFLDYRSLEAYRKNETIIPLADGFKKTAYIFTVLDKPYAEGGKAEEVVIRE